MTWIDRFGVGIAAWCLSLLAPVPASAAVLSSPWGADVAVRVIIGNSGQVVVAGVPRVNEPYVVFQRLDDPNVCFTSFVGLGDTILGSNGNDIILQVPTTFRPCGRTVNPLDAPVGSGGWFYIDARSGDDLVYAHDGAGWVFGGNGRDRIMIHSGNAYGDGHEDVLIGGSAGAALKGGSGNDWLCALTRVSQMLGNGGSNDHGWGDANRIEVEDHNSDAAGMVCYATVIAFLNALNF